MVFNLKKNVDLSYFGEPPTADLRRRKSCYLLHCRDVRGGRGRDERGSEEVRGRQSEVREREREGVEFRTKKQGCGGGCGEKES